MVLFRERLFGKKRGKKYIKKEKRRIPAKRSFVKSFVSHLDGDELHFHP